MVALDTQTAVVGVVTLAIIASGAILLWHRRREALETPDASTPDIEAPDIDPPDINYHKWGTIVGVLALVVGGEFLLLQSVGAFDWTIYNILFAAGAGGVPALIYMAAPSFPGFLRSAMGRGMMILGAASWGDWWLVQRDEGWEVCPGDGDAVYVDGQWHGVDGVENRSVLGWSTFGIVRYKDDRTFQQYARKRRKIRSWVDGDVEDPILNPPEEVGVKSISLPDGGESAEAEGVTRADGTVSVDFNHGLSGRDGPTIDLMQYWSDGLSQAADLSLIAKAEEIAKREAADGPVGSGYETAVVSIVGLILGAGTAMVMLYA